MRNSFKNLTLGAIALGALSLTACMGDNANPIGTDGETAKVLVNTKAGNIDKLSKPGLAKSALITLETLTITAISNASTPDTVQVVLEVGDSGFVADAETDQNISVVLDLKALRTWYITAETHDANDSLIQTGTDTLENLLAGQVRAVNLSATPLFAMYKSTFNFPDSIFSPTGLFGQKMNISKIEMLIDGDVISDSSDTFEAATDYVLEYDYVSVDADSVSLKVYGFLPTSDSTWSDVENILYEKTRPIDSLSTSSVNNVALDWKGPVDGAASLEVEIGQVGTYEIEGETDPEVLSKK